MLGKSGVEKKYFKETENILREYRYIDIVIKSIEIDIECLEKGISINTLYGFESNITLDTLNKKREFYITRKNIVNSALKSLNENELKIIKVKYLSHKVHTWVDIRNDLSISKTNCLYWRDTAVNKVTRSVFYDKF